MGASSARPVRPKAKGFNPRTKPADDKTKFDKWLEACILSETTLEFQMKGRTKPNETIIARVLEVDRYMLRVRLVEELEQVLTIEAWINKGEIVQCSVY